MDRLSPLLELRSEWRQAAAVSAPVAAAELADILDRALDLLELHSQLDEKGLAMAVDLVCRSFAGRPDEVEVLRHRLRRAARDYSVTTATRGMEDTSGTAEAFTSEEALARTLFGIDKNAITPVAPAPAGPPPPRSLDEKAMRRSLSNKGRRRRRSILSLLPLVLVISAIVGALFYFYFHPPTVTFVPGPTPSATATATAAPAGERSGTFSGTLPTCPSGAVASSSCTWPFVVSGAGTAAFTLRWDTGDRLTLDLLDQTGAAVVQPVTTADGLLKMTTPPLTPATYQLRVTNTGGARGPINFHLVRD